jgi:TusA-related sulfurtransferase
MFIGEENSVGNSGYNGYNGGNGEAHSDMPKFESVFQVDVPKGRDGKHKQIVLRLLEEIAQLNPGMALKVPFNQLPDTKENIRAALSRAARQKELDIATSSNAEYLFVWKLNKDKSDNTNGV